MELFCVPKKLRKKNTSKKSCKSSGKVPNILVFQNADAFHDRKSKTTEDHPTMYMCSLTRHFCLYSSSSVVVVVVVVVVDSMDFCSRCEDDCKQFQSIRQKW